MLGGSGGLSAAVIRAQAKDLPVKKVAKMRKAKDLPQKKVAKMRIMC
jgi:hypothetical protein